MANNWIVIGPGRTGSFTIVKSIRQLYNDVSLIKEIGTDIIPGPIEDNTIVHTHNHAWLSYANQNTEVIVTIRNPIESSLSWIIQPKLGRYHFFPRKSDIHEYVNFKVEKFYLKPSDFIERYNMTMSWYSNLKMKHSYKILDYDAWSKKPSSIMTLLGYKVDANLNELPLRSPGKHETWISNYDEILEIANSLNKEIVFNYID